MHNKKTLIIGASNKPERYSYKAFHMLSNHGHETILLGNRDASLNGQMIRSGQPTLHGIDTVSLYVNPTIQKNYYDYILDIRPKRVIFNPGTENQEFLQQCLNAGIEPIEACTLVLLSTGQY